ncbi:MAG TPA: hypothetical protein H9685_05260 [Firmicutes bacterium]|nr:hypothetical protein [Bacillota bacterium]
MKRRILTFFITLCMVCSLLPNVVFAATTVNAKPFCCQAAYSAVSTSEDGATAPHLR